VTRALRNALGARFGPFRHWPNEALLLDEPLALAEEKTSKLRRIYANAGRDLWDGPAIFREVMARHGGIQLDPERRIALAHPISMLMWGELAAWIVAAELAGASATRRQARRFEPGLRRGAATSTRARLPGALHVPVPGSAPTSRSPPPCSRTATSPSSCLRCRSSPKARPW
jgi:hypothetical protein